MTILMLATLCVTRANAQRMETPVLATATDAVPLTIAAAEEMGAHWAKPEAPVATIPSDAGTTNRTCTEASANSMHSGELVSMGWSIYDQVWRSGYGKIMWRPTAAGNAQSDTLTVRTVRLDVPSTPWIFKIPPTPSPKAPGFIYPSGIRLPSTGKWMFIATSGQNWGCFIYTMK
jgi:hypothetical protein